MEKYRVQKRNAGIMKKWIETRGGVLIWKSINLSNPGGEWMSPAKQENGEVYTKPNWQCGNEPIRHITDISEVEIIMPKEVKRFHVGVRRGSQGLSLKVTDGGTRRIERECDKAGKGSWYEFDYEHYENCVIFVPNEIVPLSEVKLD